MPNENYTMAQVQARAKWMAAFGFRPDAGDIEEVVRAFKRAKDCEQSDYELDFIAMVALWVAGRPEVVQELQTAAKTAEEVAARRAARRRAP